MQIDQAYGRLNLVQDFVPAGSSNRPARPMTPSSITIHNTDNESRGANAAAHARYMKGEDARARKVSWHFTVDDNYVYQSIPTNESAWHAGDREGNGNRSSVAIEICMNEGLDFKRAYERAALLAALLAYRLDIQVPDAIHQHHYWSGKDCPTVLRHTENGWSDFVDQVLAIRQSLTPVPTEDILVSDNDHHHGAA